MWLFVVCGAEEHIQTLNFSLKALRRHSRLPIRVVTDLARNEAPIEHDDVLDIRIDSRYNHHQASILLKTGLHQLVDLSGGKRYAYLDTDVVAIRPGVDALFEQYVAPITFCTDHCKMRQFSPSAVHCPEFAIHLVEQNRLVALMDEARRIKDNSEAQAHILKLHEEWKKRNALTAVDWLWNIYVSMGKPLAMRPLMKTWCQLKGFKIHHKPDGTWYASKAMAFDLFFAQSNLRYEPETKCWFDLDGTLIWDTLSSIDYVESRSEFRWDSEGGYWFDPEGKKVLEPMGTDTLRTRIEEKFGVVVTEPDWQHWNGGVFLFDAASVPLLDTWNAWTKEIFEDPAWKTRDQGTLIASVWQHGLQNHPTLPLEYNFLADYNHPTMRYLGKFLFELRPDGVPIAPKLLHIYHHWGDEQWQVWQDVIKS